MITAVHCGSCSLSLAPALHKTTYPPTRLESIYLAHQYDDQQQCARVTDWL